MRNLILLFLWIPLISWAQRGGFEPVKVEDFNSVALSGEEDYDALFLERLEYVYFSSPFSTFTNSKVVHERILIVNVNGLDYATEQIKLYIAGETNELVEDIIGTTYNLVNGEIITSELDESAIFTEDKNEYWQTTTFTMPAVTEGTIVDFSYKIVSPYTAIEDINIQYDVPINNLNIVVALSRGLLFNVAFNPEALYKINFDEETIAGDVKEATNFDPNTQEDLQEDSVYVNQVLTIKDQLIAVITKAVPATVEEPMSGGVDRYRAKLIFEVAATKYRNGSYKYYATDWKAVATSISKNDKFGKQLSSTRFFRNDLSLVVDSITDDIEKAFVVLKFLQSKVKWNGNYSRYVIDGVKDAYKKGSGNVAEVNLLLTSMLNEAGLEAYPVLVSSKNNGTPLFPTQDGFDYVITQLVIGDESYLMDGTAPYSYFNIIPQRAAHWKGRVIKSKEISKWVDLESQVLSKDIVMIAATLDSDFNSAFETKRRLTNYSAFSQRSRYDEATDKEIKEYLESNTFGLTVNDFKMVNKDEVDKPLNITYSGVYKNGINKIGDKLYVTPLLYDTNDENPFKLETRKYPLDLSYPMETKTIVNISIPIGYEVESIPESVKFDYNDGVGSYSYLIRHQGNIISTVATFTLTTSLIRPEDYVPFRNFFISVVDKDAERIVLKMRD
jgi:hypothetical protein